MMCRDVEAFGLRADAEVPGRLVTGSSGQEVEKPNLREIFFTFKFEETLNRKSILSARLISQLETLLWLDSVYKLKTHLMGVKRAAVSQGLMGRRVIRKSTEGSWDV